MVQQFSIGADDEMRYVSGLRVTRTEIKAR
jgi:hypothetical protein